MAIDSEPALERPAGWQEIENIVSKRLGNQSNSTVYSALPQHPVGIYEAVQGLSVCLAVSEIRIYPSVGWQKSARISLLSAVSSACASGLDICSLGVCLNLPDDISVKKLTSFWQRVHREAEKLEIPVTANWTRINPHSTLPLVGSFTAMASGPSSAVKTPAGARDGDVLILTKCAGIEAAAMLANACSDEIAETFGRGFAEDSVELFRQLSAVKDVRSVIATGLCDTCVTGMMHVGSIGIIRAAEQYSAISGLGLEIHRERVPLFDDVDAILSHFELDPLTTGSQGVLLISCKPDRSDAVAEAILQAGGSCAVVGSVRSDFDGVRLLDSGIEVDIQELAPDRLSELLDATISSNRTED